jgi:hypothetical protein
MRILHLELAHPTQVNRLRVVLYRYQPPAEQAVAGMLPAQPGFHLTEERISTTTMVKSLGFFAEEAEARRRMEQRLQELAGQGWSVVPEAPKPPGAMAGRP